MTLAKELEALGVDLVVLDQNIDGTTASGRLLFNMLAAIAEFERDLIRERVIAGMRRAKAQGRHLGRPAKYRVDLAKSRGPLATGRGARAGRSPDGDPPGAGGCVSHSRPGRSEHPLGGVVKCLG